MMRRIWVPTVILATMAVMFWQAPFYTTGSGAAAAAITGPASIWYDSGCLPESVLFNPRLTADIYARRFCARDNDVPPWDCSQGHLHAHVAGGCDRFALADDVSK